MLNLTDFLPALFNYGEIAHVYLRKHITDDQISDYLEYLHKPTTTYGKAYKHITEDLGLSANVFYALESLERINALCDAAECPSEQAIEPEKAFIVAFSALRAGMLIGAVAGDMGKEKIIDLEKSPENVLSSEWEKNFRKEMSKTATNAKYKERRKLLTQAGTVARQLWESGNNKKHHEMKKYLVEEYQDQTGKHPFLYLPESAILQRLKVLAREIDRPDLISGQKKSS